MSTQAYLVSFAQCNVHNSPALHLLHIQHDAAASCSLSSPVKVSPSCRTVPRPYSTHSTSCVVSFHVLRKKTVGRLQFLFLKSKYINEVSRDFHEVPSCVLWKRQTQSLPDTQQPSWRRQPCCPGGNAQQKWKCPFCSCNASHQQQNSKYLYHLFEGKRTSQLRVPHQKPDLSFSSFKAVLGADKPSSSVLQPSNQH